MSELWNSELGSVCRGHSRDGPDPVAVNEVRDQHQERLLVSA